MTSKAGARSMMTMRGFGEWSGTKHHKEPSISGNAATSFLFLMSSNLFVDLKAPNGRDYKQPIGLFINNEFVASKSGEKITSINPR